MLFIGVVIYAISFIFEHQALFLSILGIIVVAFLLNAYTKKQDALRTKQEHQRAEETRLNYLHDKYKNEHIVQLIWERRFWQGQTREQLMDSLGPPAAVDTKTLKTKHREVWKYSPMGVNRYALRITVDDGQVSGWDQKT